MRGKVCGNCRKVRLWRITPAYAGKSWCLCRRSLWNWGSPPPMRGKVPHSFVHHLSTRITPAYAGKRLSPVCQKLGTEDHPRLCGEKAFGNSLLHRFIGSPPPMRGKVPVKLLPDVCTRITPAYAGKSNQTTGNERRLVDHPRLCGEKFADNRYIYIEIGSPPPMRGKG